jgi:hypothetical protein
MRLIRCNRKEKSMKRIFAVLALLAAIPVCAQQQNCLTSSATAWTSTAFSAQAASFQTVPFTITPNSSPPTGTGGPIVGISSTAQTGTTPNYQYNATLIRQSENGFWEVFNGSKAAYAHDVAVQWLSGTPATFTWQINMANKTATVLITQANTSCATGCTLAAAYPFRTTAPATPLGWWNLDNTSTTETLTVCGFAIQMPTPTLTGINPTSGPLGTSVAVSGTNFGSTQGNSVVSFGGVPATTVSAWSATSITATVPNTATTGNVVVTVNNLMSSGTYVFTVVPVPNPNPPVITSLSSSFTMSIACGPNQPPPSAHSATLAWTASTSSGVTGYNVYRSTTSGSGYTKLGSTTATILTYTDAPLVSGTTLYYVVTAVAGANESVYSNQASATIP